MLSYAAISWIIQIRLQQFRAIYLLQNVDDLTSQCALRQDRFVLLSAQSTTETPFLSLKTSLAYMMIRNINKQRLSLADNSPSHCLLHSAGLLRSLHSRAHWPPCLEKNSFCWSFCNPAGSYGAFPGQSPPLAPLRQLLS